MEYEITLAKGKGLITKDADINKIGIWINGSSMLGKDLSGKMKNSMNIIIGDSHCICWIGDSSQPIRFNSDGGVLIHLLVEIDPLLCGVLIQNNLKLNLN